MNCCGLITIGLERILEALLLQLNLLILEVGDLTPVSFCECWELLLSLTNDDGTVWEHSVY